MKKHKRVATVETVEWIVSYYSPLYGVMKTGKFKDEVTARDYFNEKKEEKRKELTLIKKITTTKFIEEYA